MKTKKAAKRSTREIAEAINAVATMFEEEGNTGAYTGEIPTEWRWVMGVRYLPERRGILFYSKGWGWRVRTNPSWRSVFDERFYKLEKADPKPDETPAHSGFYTEVEGQPIHVLGDVNMSEETLEVIRKVAKAAIRMMDEKEAGNEQAETQK